MFHPVTFYLAVLFVSMSMGHAHDAYLYFANKESYMRWGTTCFVLLLVLPFIVVPVVAAIFGVAHLMSL